MARLKPLILPAVMLLLGLWLVYDNVIAPNPMFRYPKAEAGGFIFTFLGLVWLGFAVYRVAVPLPLAVGRQAYVISDGQVLEGPIVALDKSQCTLRTPRGDITVSRHAIDGLRR